MRVLNLEPYGYSQQAIEKWTQAGCEYKASNWDELITPQPDVDTLVIRLNRRIGSKELKFFPNLKYLLTATTGLDHVDLVELKSRDITLVSLRGEMDFLKTIPSTAEHTWALCLALIRNIHGSIVDVTKGNWNRDRFRGVQLKGKQLGIIGLGRTGLKVASYGDAFDMDVAYYDPYVNHDLYRRYEELSALLEKSDIISIHVHLTEETENLLNTQLLISIKKGAYIINTSRGKIWDEQAVYHALLTGQLAGVATDVLATELDNVRESTLWKAMNEGRNVIITPHIGGATWDAMWACEDFIVEKTLKIYHGR